MSELIVTEQLNPIQIFAEGGADPLLQKIREMANEFEPDLTTEAGRKEIASFAYKIARSKTTLDDMGKKLIEDETKRINAVHAERRRVRDELDELKEKVRKPLTDWENEQKAHVEQCRSLIDGIEELARQAQQGWDSIDIDQMEGSINDIRNVEQAHGVEWREFQYKADEVKKLSIKIIEECIAKRKEHDKKLAELEKARIEREAREAEAERQRIAEEAAAKAKAEAEAIAKAEAEKVERERQAEREKLEREKREAEEAAARAEKEAAEAAQKERDRIEAMRIADEEAAAKREANKRHKGKINSEAKQTLMDVCGLDEKAAKDVVKAIALNTISHITITY